MLFKEQAKNPSHMRKGLRRSAITLCRLLLGIIMFAQVVDAVQACIAPGMSPVMAFVQHTHNDHCNKRPNPNSCLQQSTASDQTFDHTETPVFAASSVAILTLPWDSDCAIVGAILPVAPSPSAADPPTAIRFCTLQL
jgi:hypothetical protein